MLTNSDADMRAFTLADLPLVHRLKAQGISLDSESYLARGLHTLEDAALSSLPVADLGTPTLIARYGQQAAFGQFRYVRGSTHAHIMFVAPALTNGYTETMEAAWLHLLDGLAREAGARGAQVILAEVDENSVVFEALRRAGYASYARQDIWRRDPAPPPVYEVRVPLPRKATERDLPAVRYLHAQAVPRLAQQADPAPNEDGLVSYREGKAWSYIAVSEGTRGLYLKPYLHPEAEDMAQDVLSAALHHLTRASRVPVYCCVRQYQTWLGSKLEALGFTPWARQTVMVKHTTSRVEHPSFAPLPSVQGGLPISGGNSGKA
jgi:hypothetical protein